MGPGLGHREECRLWNNKKWVINTEIRSQREYTNIFNSCNFVRDRAIAMVRNPDDVKRGAVAIGRRRHRAFLLHDPDQTGFLKLRNRYRYLVRTANPHPIMTHILQALNFFFFKFADRWQVKVERQQSPGRRRLRTYVHWRQFWGTHMPQIMGLSAREGVKI